MSAHTTDWAALGLHGCSPFDVAPRTITQTLEQEKAEAHRLDCLQRYHRTKAIAAATRVNKENFSISPTPQADADKQSMLKGQSFVGRRS